jgi:hypothetical protein
MKQHFKTIYISNILEGYYKSYLDLPKKRRDFWIQYDTLDSNRALMYGDDNKVVVTASPILKKHFESMKTLLGWKNVINLSPEKPDYSISEDCYSDAFLRKELIRIIHENPGIAIIPYRLTPQFQKLIHYLTKKQLHFTAPETIPQDKQFILNYFNTKRGFRHLWHIAQADNPPHIQIPEGFITEDKQEAIEAAWWFKMHHKSFVMKYNKGTQGIGVQMVDHKSLPTDKDEFTSHLKKLLSDKIWRGSAIIIEETVAINASGESASPSIEIYIAPDGTVSESYPCDQVLAEDKKTFRGIYIYPDLYKDPTIQHAFDAGRKFGRQLARYGYRGVFDVDLIRSNDNMMYAVESNLRRTGGTHLHELCLALLGKNYGEHNHALIEDLMLKPNHGLDYNSCTKLFTDDLYTKDKGVGIILSNPDMLQVNILMVVLIGKDKKDIIRLRKTIARKLEHAVQ